MVRLCRRGWRWKRPRIRQIRVRSGLSGVGKRKCWWNGRLGEGLISVCAVCFFPLSEVFRCSDLLPNTSMLPYPLSWTLGFVISLCTIFELRFDLFCDSSFEATTPGGIIWCSSYACDDFWKGKGDGCSRGCRAGCG